MNKALLCRRAQRGKSNWRLTAAALWPILWARRIGVPAMGIEETDPHVIEGLVLMHAFLKIADATDRRKVIELAARLARASSPPLSPR
jgi:hypothetical protein